VPALFAYLIAVAVLLGGGYGALNWLAAPEPVKVLAKAKQPASPRRYADDIGASSTQPIAAQANLSETAKPEVTSKPEIDGTDQVKTASNERAASSDQPPSPQPEQPSAAGRQGANAEGSGPAQERDHSAPVETHQTAAQDVSPGNAQSAASIAPASTAKSQKRPQVRQASRGSEKRPLEMMTLRTVELPDGRRMTQLIPYRSRDRYRNDGPAMAFGPDD
jgi:hypothetical protein